MDRPHKATLKQIAEEAGVSIDTVSRVLNGKNKEKWPMAAKRAAAIRAIAQRLEYQPNSSARATQSGHTGMLALLQRAHGHFPWPLLDGIYNGVVKHDVHLAMAAVPHENFAKAALQPKIVRERLCEGMLVNHHFITKEERLAVLASGIPCIFLNVKEKNDCIYPDEIDAGRMLCQHLIQAGHREIVFLDANNDRLRPGVHFSAFDRYAGYVAAMKNAGLEPQLISGQALKTGEERIGFCTAWLKRGPRVTAVVTDGERTALAFLIAAAYSGIEIPRDMSLVSLAAEPITNCGVLITTAISPWLALGEQAVSMLIEKVQTNARAVPSIAVPFKIAQGLSDRPIC